MVMQKKEKKELTVIEIEGLDTKASLQLLGSEKLFWAALSDYFRVIDKKCELIKAYETEEKWKEYTIEVHALKSSSRQIGAMELADKAERMEKAGNDRDATLIHSATDEMLKKYRWHQEILKEYFVKEKSKDKSAERQITKEELTELFRQMQDAMEELDSDEMEAVLSKMEGYSYEEEQQKLLERLREAVEDIDTEECETVLQEWEGIIT